MTVSVSSRLCGEALKSAAVVEVGEQLIAHVSQVAHCGSPWCCPVCTPVVREQRAGEIDQGLGGHLDAGGFALFVSLTVRHHRGDGLGPRMALMATAMGEVLKGESWTRRRDALGYVGVIRAVEVTWGEANGWHPHTHGVLLFDRPLTEVEQRDLETWLRGRWATHLLRQGFGTVNDHGVDVRPVHKAGDLAGYLAKVEGGWGAGLELARSDLKRSSSRLVPAQILGQLVETGETRWRDLWCEYERATFGRRAIVWSKGLKARLGVSEVTDEEAAAVEAEDAPRWRVVVPAAEWNAMLHAGTAADWLTDLELRCGEAMRRGLMPGPLP